MAAVASPFARDELACLTCFELFDVVHVLAHYLATLSGQGWLKLCVLKRINLDSRHVCEGPPVSLGPQHHRPHL